ncbi:MULTISPECIES: MarR family winged helix-turn-helix transcriptional regulator [Micromonospora]|jgi:DNA-binding MarR family transcriptional regulator|uniref:Transcriptional regulator, MarR family n=1 Tax=Micromonospora rifamycinica TaxID=291594 RepID=A0A109IHX4_9ACTN|nr:MULTISPECIES: MarR family winged helix-turn-helix transcriptional regulator [Micromonospora]KWV30867.1 MarR family transcriptional regulator [Micromonospora rifamycinica]WFE66421.1 MarR family winged helix-turn-helix transcriptional regulator [Micromonospora sp. WMMD714]WFE93404.1 MarR family winged helix-turn-helix transcriptional regulator [Micromonospora sp. WMMD987]SCG35872.1 transcriptional regulator, MarR family [Micromonospora rifamycinica]
MSPVDRTRSTGRDRLRDSVLAGDLSFLLARANALALAAANAALAEHGLKARSYSVLALAADDVRPTQRELAEFLRLDPSQVVALIDGLAQRALVERRADPADRRANVLVATDAGRELFARAQDSVRAVGLGSLPAVTPREHERLARLLRLLAFPD